MTVLSTISKGVLSTLAVLLALPALAQDQAGSVTGTFGDQPLEMIVTGELSGVTIIGDFTDASFLAVQTEGEQGPITLELTVAGELPDPEEVMLTITSARDMGRTWTGDQDTLTLTLGEVMQGDGVVAFNGTLTGEVSGGPASETRPVALEFETRLDMLD